MKIYYKIYILQHVRITLKLQYFICAFISKWALKFYDHSNKISLPLTMFRSNDFIYIMKLKGNAKNFQNAVRLILRQGNEELLQEKRRRAREEERSWRNEERQRCERGRMRMRRTVRGKGEEGGRYKREEKENDRMWGPLKITSYTLLWTNHLR